MLKVICTAKTDITPAIFFAQLYCVTESHVWHGVSRNFLTVAQILFRIQQCSILCNFVARMCSTLIGQLFLWQSYNQRLAHFRGKVALNRALIYSSYIRKSCVAVKKLRDKIARQNRRCVISLKLRTHQQYVEATLSYATNQTTLMTMSNIVYPKANVSFCTVVVLAAMSNEFLTTRKQKYEYDDNDEIRC